MTTISFMRIGSIPKSTLDAFYVQLSDNQKQVYKAYTDVASRNQSLCGKLLLSHLLKNISPNSSLNDIVYNEYGKPEIKNGPGISLSHSGDIVTCAISQTHNIGIDIEELTKIDIEQYREYFLQKEWDAIHNSESPTNTFFRLWTRKEAIIKATGKGLTYAYNDINTIDNLTTLDNVCYYSKNIQAIDNYLIAFASDHSIDNVTINEIKHENIQI